MDLHITLVGRHDLSGEIYRQIRRAIATGHLRPGDSLPASRALAQSLRVSRTTVTVAYDRLAGEGYLFSRMGAGTYVSSHFASSSKQRFTRPTEDALQPKAFWNSIRVASTFDNPAKFDFRTGLPEARLFPHEMWRRLMGKALRAEAQSGGVYDHPAGHYGLREAIARHVGISRGLQITAEDITITCGAQQALDVIARTLLEPGHKVAVENPGYPPPRLLFQSLGAHVQGVAVDDEGIRVDELPRDVRLVYTTPSHQYPLGVTMSLSRRLALLEWAARNNAAIIEDDYDSEFRFAERPVEPLQTLDTSGRVLYVGSFSKTLLPTLRLGFVVTPNSCTSAVHRAKYLTDWHTSMVVQEALARFIDNGGFAQHLRRVGRIYAERRALLTEILGNNFGDHFTLVPSVAGIHVTAVARSATADQIGVWVRRAADQGVQVQELSRFSYGPPTSVGLMFGYGAITTSQIREGLEKLRSCIDQEG